MQHSQPGRTVSQSARDYGQQPTRRRRRPTSVLFVDSVQFVIYGGFAFTVLRGEFMGVRGESMVVGGKHIPRIWGNLKPRLADTLGREKIRQKIR